MCVRFQCVGWPISLAKAGNTLVAREQFAQLSTMSLADDELEARLSASLDQLRVT